MTPPRVDAQAAEKVRAALDVLRSPGPTLGGWRLSPKDHHYHCASRTTAVDGKVPDCDCYAVAHQPGRDALDSLAAELVSLKDALRKIDYAAGNIFRVLELGRDDPETVAGVTFVNTTDIRAAAREALGSQA